MQFHDVTISNQRERDTTSVCLVNLRKNIDASTALGSYSLRDTLYLGNMAEQVISNKSHISNFQFNLNDLHDQISLRKFSFSNTGLL